MGGKCCFFPFLLIFLVSRYLILWWTRTCDGTLLSGWGWCFWTLWCRLYVKIWDWNTCTPYCTPYHTRTAYYICSRIDTARAKNNRDNSISLNFQECWFLCKDDVYTPGSWPEWSVSTVASQYCRQLRTLRTFLIWQQFPPRSIPPLSQIRKSFMGIWRILNLRFVCVCSANRRKTNMLWISLMKL